MILKRFAIVLVTCGLGSLAGAGHHSGQHMKKDGKAYKHSDHTMNSKYQVKRVQKALNKKGYNLDEDGVMGTETSNALHEYQLENNLQPTHRIDNPTLVSLGIVTTTPGWKDSKTRRPASVDSEEDSIFSDEELGMKDRRSMYKQRSFNVITAGFGIPESALEKDLHSKTLR